MLIPLVVLDLIFIGASVLTWLKFKLHFEEKLGIGLLLGFIFLGFTNLILCYLFGLNLLSFLLTLLIINLIPVLKAKVTAVIVSQDFFELVKRLKEKAWRIYLGFLISIILILSFLASSLLTFSNDTYSVGLVHSYGDISLHLGIINSFAKGDNFPVTNPILVNQKISYPFLVDFITAIFMNPLGLREDQAVALTGVLFSISLVIVLAFFALKLTGSKLASVLLLILFIFHGGLGGVKIYDDFIRSGQNFLTFITQIPRDYTALKDQGYWWINVVISMLLPQRSFLLGLPFAIFIFRIFWDLKEKFDYPKYLFAILLFSLLPLIHAHSMMILSPFLLWLGLSILVKNKKKSVLLILPLLVSLFVILFQSKQFLQQASNLLALFTYQPGWMSHQENILQFYFKNFNINLLLIPISLIWGLTRQSRLVALSLIAQIWFILGSLFLFQPWEYDNVKIFIYWYIFSLPLLTLWLVNIYRGTFGKLIVCVLMLILTFSGVLDVYRLFTAPLFGNSTVKYPIYIRRDLSLARFIEQNTPKNAVFIGEDKFNNPAVTLAGRKSIFGFRGWLWTYGLDYSKEAGDVALVLGGGESSEIAKKYNASYIIVFGTEEYFYVDKKALDKMYNRIYNQDGYEIYEIKEK